MLLLVRVDTGRGVVRSTLRRRVRGIGRIVDYTARRASSSSAPARLVVILVAFYLG